MAVEPRYFAVRAKPDTPIYLCRRLVQVESCGWETYLGLGLDIIGMRDGTTREWVPVDPDTVTVSLRESLVGLPEHAYARVAEAEVMGLRLLGQVNGVHTTGRSFGEYL